MRALPCERSGARPAHDVLAHQIMGNEWVGRLARLRVVQFAVIGGAIFAAERLHRRNDVNAIELTSTGIRSLRDAEAARAGAAGGRAGEVDERAIEDEILYREGKKLGFDRDDPVVRQRVVQKTLYLAEELAGAGESPTEAELRRFYDATRSEWRRPGHVHFVHVFASGRDEADALAGEADARFARGEPTAGLGEASPVPPEATMDHDRIASALGVEFADALPTLPVGRFSGPIPSALGWHLVRVVEREPGRQASFEEARSSLVGAYVVKRRKDAIAAFLVRSFRDYDVRIDGAKVASLSPSGRLAARPTESGED